MSSQTNPLHRPLLRRGGGALVAVVAVVIVVLLYLANFSVAQSVYEVDVGALKAGTPWEQTWLQFEMAGFDLINLTEGYITMYFENTTDSQLLYNGQAIGSLKAALPTLFVTTVGSAGKVEVRFQAVAGTSVTVDWYKGEPLVVPPGGLVVEAHTFKDGSRYTSRFALEGGEGMGYAVNVSAPEEVGYFGLVDQNASHYGLGYGDFGLRPDGNGNSLFLYSPAVLQYHLEVAVETYANSEPAVPPNANASVEVVDGVIEISVTAAEYNQYTAEAYLPSTIPLAYDVVWGFETAPHPDPTQFNLTTYSYDLSLQLDATAVKLKNGGNVAAIEGHYRVVTTNATNLTVSYPKVQDVTLEKVHFDSRLVDSDQDGFPATDLWVKDYLITNGGDTVTEMASYLVSLTALGGQQPDAQDSNPEAPNGAADLDDDGLSTRWEVFRFGSDPLNNDTDGDGIDDYLEYLSSPFIDTDDDGLSDAQEVSLGSSPVARDTDGDFLEDGAEARYWWFNGQAPEGDLDGDGYANIVDTWADVNNLTIPEGGPYDSYYYDRDGIQLLTLGTDPAILDSDGDGPLYALDGQGNVLTYTPSDGYEAQRWLDSGYTLTTDSDGDGLYNHQDGDSDNDGVPDWTEWTVWDYLHTIQGFNPDGGLSYTSDPTTTHSDSDGIDDYIETYTYRTNPGSTDSDGDGLTDPLELSLPGSGDTDGNQTNPIRQDTDMDWLTDGQEDVNSDGGVDANETDPLNPDTDNDTLLDGFEALYPPVFNPLSWNDAQGDYDSDGIIEYQEMENRTSPLTNDTDGDSMDDKWEIDNGTDPLVDDAAADPDGDGLNNTVEYHGWMVTVVRYPDANATTYLARSMPLFADGDSDGQDDPSEKANQTDPYRYDTDGDGLWDGYDRNLSGTLYYGELTATTNVTNWNSDSDGLSDGAEVYGWDVPWNSSLHFTSDPHLNDTDNDTLWDGSEYLNQSNPRDNDTDDDGLLDSYEVYGWLVTVYNHTVPSHARPWHWSDFSNASESYFNVTSLPYISDTEGDGLNDYAEWLNGSNPNVADTDGDSISDYDEVVTYSTSAFSDDSDNDYLLDVIELGLWWDLDDSTTTNASNPDTDGDQIIDGKEDENVDGVVNVTETDPNNNDTDEDGLLDGLEQFTVTQRALSRVAITTGGYNRSTANLSTIAGEGQRSYPELDRLISLVARYGLIGVNSTNLSVRIVSYNSSISTYNLFVTSHSGLIQNDSLVVSTTLYQAEANASTNLVTLSQAKEAAKLGWDLEIFDNGNNATGWIESFEVEYTYSTLPLTNDSDGDGLLDGEEVNYGAYGFISNPWRTDSDGDNLTDYAEVVKTSDIDWLTDPGNPDTDGDGYWDDGDINPVGNAFIEFAPSYLKVVPSSVSESDDLPANDATKLDIYFSASIQYEENNQPVTNGTYRTDLVAQLGGYKEANLTSRHGIAFDVPDNISQFTLTLGVWDFDGLKYDSGGGDGNGDYRDDHLDMKPNSGNSITLNYDATTDALTGDDTDGDTQGDHIRLKYDISVVGESRNYVWALLPRAEDGSLTGGPLHHLVTNDTAETGDDWYRYIGQGRYFIFEVEVTDEGPGFLARGNNTIIVPEGVFYSTKFYTLLNSTDQANVSTNFSFLPTDTTTWTAPGNNSASAAYIVSLIVVQLTDSQAHQLVETLWQNETGANASGLWSMSNSYPLYLSGFPLPVVEMAPHHYTNYPKHEPGKSFSFWGEVVNVLFKGTVYVLSGQAFYDGLVLISKQLGLDRDWNINVSWDDIVGAVTGFFGFMVDKYKEMIIAPFRSPMNEIKKEGQNDNQGAYVVAHQLNTAFNDWVTFDKGNPLIAMSIGSLFTTDWDDSVYKRLTLALIIAVDLVLVLIISIMVILTAIFTFLTGPGGPIIGAAVAGIAMATAIFLLYWEYFRDTDGDGLSTIDEWILAPNGADPNKKDLFVEIDYYEGTDYEPNGDALEYIDAYYDNIGINIHLWVNDEIDTDDRHYYNSGLNNGSRDAIERWHHNRDTTYIYVVLVNFFSDYPDADGVYYGDWGIFIAMDNMDDRDGDGGLRDETQTIMHEIGHNIGMHHDDDPHPIPDWGAMQSGRIPETYEDGETFTTAFPNGGPAYSDHNLNHIDLANAIRNYSWL